MGRSHKTGNHHGETRPDGKMGAEEKSPSSTVRGAVKHRAAKKRRQHDKHLSEDS